MRCMLLPAIGLILVNGPLDDALARGGPAPPAVGHALLVGCTRYPGLEKSLQLEGPANDVALMRSVLIERFRFSPQNITVLAEGDGGEVHRPTRRNIERAFHDLATAARSGDRVVILLAGHGSYQPDQAPFDEPDGTDELFLPADISGWDHDGQRVKNAIVDDELRGWLDAIRARGASVWLVMDSCHSGTMMRGNGSERSRRVRPEDLGIPAAALAKARRPGERKADRANGAMKEACPFDLPKDGPGIVALYAAHPDESAPELPLPDDVPDAKRYGLFTYTIAEILTGTRGAISYRQLIRRVHDRYAALGRPVPTPMIEGDDQDRSVLGREKFDSAEIRLAREGDHWTIDAGALHGLTPGTILAVHEMDHDGKPGPLKGHARIIERGFQPIRARVEPCLSPEPGGPAIKDLPDHGLCQPVFIDYGVFRLKVAVDEKDGEDRPLPEADRRRLADLKDLLGRTIAKEARDRKARHLGPGKGALIEIVSDPKQADWLLRIESPRTARIDLVPGAGVALDASTGKLPPLFGPVPEGAPAGAWLKDRLARIAAARNLLKIAGSAPAVRFSTGLEIKLDVELRRYEDEGDDKGQPITASNGATIFRDGEIIGVRLTNSSREDVDVTLLFIDSGFGIKPLFPFQLGADNRLKKGDSIVPRFRVTAETTGLEHLLVIAVKSRIQGLPADFSVLAQETIEKARGRGRGPGPNVLDSPLGRLLQAARYEGARSVHAVTTVGDHQLRLFSWHTRARKQRRQVEK